MAFMAVCLLSFIGSVIYIAIPSGIRSIQLDALRDAAYRIQCYTTVTVVNIVNSAVKLASRVNDRHIIYLFEVI